MTPCRVSAADGAPQPYVLRPATLDDARLLWVWRNDPATRRASRNPAAIPFDEHSAWFAAVLANPKRKLLVAERDGVAVGTVRADLSDAGWELSWTVAPDQRGRGVGKAIVTAAARSTSGPMQAVVKRDNLGSAAIALHAGLRLVGEDDGILFFARP